MNYEVSNVDRLHPKERNAARRWSEFPGGVPPVVAAPRPDARPTADDGFIRRLYAEYGTDLFRYALGLTGGDSHRAEDLVQEAMLRAWRTTAGARPIRSPRSWLFSTVRNLAVDAYRARQSRPAEADQAALDSLAVADTTDRTAESVDMAEALAALRPEHREAIVEVFYRGSSMTQAATALGIPAGTVKSRMYYGLKALRLVLQERGITP
jgi:RNA polymerase sigma-70 factor, ECF subfamily